MEVLKAIKFTSVCSTCKSEISLSDSEMVWNAKNVVICPICKGRVLFTDDFGEITEGVSVKYDEKPFTTERIIIEKV